MRLHRDKTIGMKPTLYIELRYPTHFIIHEWKGIKVKSPRVLVHEIELALRKGGRWGHSRRVKPCGS